MKTKSKARFSPKQHRMAEHIEKTYEKKCYPKDRACPVLDSIYTRTSGRCMPPKMFMDKHAWAIAWSTIRKYLGEGPDSKRVVRIFL